MTVIDKKTGLICLLSETPIELETITKLNSFGYKVILPQYNALLENCASCKKGSCKTCIDFSGWKAQDQFLANDLKLIEKLAENGYSYYDYVKPEGHTCMWCEKCHKVGKHSQTKCWNCGNPELFHRNDDHWNNITMAFADNCFVSKIVRNDGIIECPVLKKTAYCKLNPFEKTCINCDEYWHSDYIHKLYLEGKKFHVFPVLLSDLLQDKEEPIEEIY